MANPGVTHEQWQEAREALALHDGSWKGAADHLQMNAETLRNRVKSGDRKFAGRAGVDGGGGSGRI